MLAMICLNDHFLDNDLTVPEASYVLTYQMTKRLRIRLYEDDGLTKALILIDGIPTLTEHYIEDPYDYLIGIAKNPTYRAFLIDYAEALPR
jgi:hypothetical protein